MTFEAAAVTFKLYQYDIRTWTTSMQSIEQQCQIDRRWCQNLKVLIISMSDNVKQRMSIQYKDPLRWPVWLCYATSA